jgi:hypothetical protein
MASRPPSGWPARWELPSGEARLENGPPFESRRRLHARGLVVDPRSRDRIATLTHIRSLEGRRRGRRNRRPIVDYGGLVFVPFQSFLPIGCSGKIRVGYPSGKVRSRFVTYALSALNLRCGRLSDGHARDRHARARDGRGIQPTHVTRHVRIARENRCVIGPLWGRDESPSLIDLRHRHSAPPLASITREQT